MAQCRGALTSCDHEVAPLDPHRGPAYFTLPAYGGQYWLASNQNHVRTDLLIYSTKIPTLLCDRHRITDLGYVSEYPKDPCSFYAPWRASSTSYPASPEPKSLRKSSPPLLMGFALVMRVEGREGSCSHLLRFNALLPNHQRVHSNERRGGRRLDFLNHTCPCRRTGVFYTVQRVWLLCISGTEHHKSDPSKETGPFQILKPQIGWCISIYHVPYFTGSKMPLIIKQSDFRDFKIFFKK